jgi:hypothetical protein
VQVFRVHSLSFASYPDGQEETYLTSSGAEGPWPRRPRPGGGGHHHPVRRLAQSRDDPRQAALERSCRVRLRGMVGIGADGRPAMINPAYDLLG